MGAGDRRLTARLPLSPIVPSIKTAPGGRERKGAKMKTWRRRRWIRIAVAVAATAVAAPMAQAKPVVDAGPVSAGAPDTAVRPDDRPGPLGVGAVREVEPVVRPDDRGDRRITSPDPVTSAVRPDDRAEPRGVGAIDPAPVPALGDSGGFDWGDAGIGVTAALALGLLAGTALFFMHRQRRSGLPAH